MIKLFLSKTLEENDPFQIVCAEKGILVHARSLINVKSIDFIQAEKKDVLFFSSPRAVQFYNLKHPISTKQSLAAIGKGTEKAINELGLKCQFVGSTAGHPSNVAKEFLCWLNQKTVCFIEAKDSLQSISKWIPINQKTNLAVYQTTHSPQLIDPHDFYVFTSPSNLTSYLNMNMLPLNAKVIAWGKSTEASCFKHKITVFSTLKTSSLTELMEILF